MSSILAHAARIRRQTPLCGEDFRLTHHDLPKANPPHWLRNGLTASLIIGLLVTVVLLVSPVEEFITAPGVVRAGDATLVFSPVAGLLESIEVVDGSVVRAGDILARLDSREASRALAALREQMARTEIELNLARATRKKIRAAPLPTEFLFSEVELTRQTEVKALQEDYLSKMRELERTGAASGVELLNLRLQVIATSAMLERSRQALALLEGDFGKATEEEATERVHLAEARLRELELRRDFLEEDLERCLIRAPRDGKVSAVTRLFPGEPVGEGVALFSLAHGDGWELRLYPSEDRMDKIQPGQLVRFRANNNPDRLAPLALGRVLDLSRDLTGEDLLPDGQLTTTTGYRVSVLVQELPYPLVLGAGVEAEIILGRRPFWRLFFLGK